MRTIASPEELRRALAPLRQDSIALVPTMGCLHEGHISLIRKAKRLADVVVVSIYVNPLQFGANEDFSRYPRTLAQDAQICADEGVNFIFNPSNLYAASGAQITLTVHSDMSDLLCGAARPGHFDGVATVVNILFNIVQPNIAIFGEKDWQQLAILRRMVADLHIPITIMAAPLVREPSGLAWSSRNRYLSDTERQQALHLYQTLRLMQQLAAAGQSIDTTLEQGRQALATQQITPQYLEIRQQQSLRPSQAKPSSEDRIFIAATIGQTRLIDNMPLLPHPSKINMNTNTENLA